MDRPTDAPAWEIHGAGEAVDQRDAVEQQPRGQRAEDEILQPGFRRTQHSSRAKPPARRSRAIAAPAPHTASSGWWPTPSPACRRWRAGSAPGIRSGADPLLVRCSRVTSSSASAGAGEDQHLDERRNVVGAVLAVKPMPCAPLRSPASPVSRNRAECQAWCRGSVLSLAEHAEQQDRHAAERQHDLRQRKVPVHQRSSSASAPRSSGNAPGCVAASLTWAPAPRCGGRPSRRPSRRRSVKLDG